MFQLGKTIVSEDIIEKDFACNLSKCKGECCVSGVAGAPLEKDETGILKEIYPKLNSFLRPEGIEAIEQQGTSIVSSLGELETPLVNNSECAYLIFNENKIAFCGIEEAYNKGIVNWKKPISCHLYPIRIARYTDFEALNYDRWSICSDACALGEELKVPVYKFLKEPLIRKYGPDFYAELEEVAAHLSAE